MSSFQLYRPDGYFKKGDRVICNHADGRLKKGHEYIVVENSEHGNVEVSEPGNPSSFPGFYPGRFEHVKEAKDRTTHPDWKIGDLVQCIDAPNGSTELTMNKVYKVTGMDEIFTRLTSDRGFTDQGYRHERFKKTTAQAGTTSVQEFKVGDFVKVVKTDGGIKLDENYTIRSAHQGGHVHDFRWLYTLTNADGNEHHFGGHYYGYSFVLATKDVKKPVIDRMVIARHKDAPLWNTNDLLINRHTGEHRYFIRYHTADFKWVFAGKTPDESDKLQNIVEWRDYVNTVKPTKPEPKTEDFTCSGTDHYPRGSKLKCVDDRAGANLLSLGAMYYYRGPCGTTYMYISETPSGPIIPCPVTSGGMWSTTRFEAWTEPKPETPTKKDSGPVQRTAPKRKAGALPRQKLLLL